MFIFTDSIPEYIFRHNNLNISISGQINYINKIYGVWHFNFRWQWIRLLKSSHSVMKSTILSAHLFCKLQLSNYQFITLNSISNYIMYIWKWILILFTYPPLRNRSSSMFLENKSVNFREIIDKTDNILILILVKKYIIFDFNLIDIDKVT